MTIAVTGATGQLGQLVINGLRERRVDGVVALARAPEKARQLDVVTRRADYDDPATLFTALAGVDTLLLISSSELGKRAAQHQSVIDAAGAAGVKRIVYTSLLHADSSPLNLAPEHRATELSLKKSGVPFTILRNGWYIENHTGSLDGAIASGAVIGSAGAGRFSAATRADFADAAVEALTGHGHEGQTYELAGDEAYSLTDLAQELSRQVGRNIVYKDLPEREYGAALASFGLPAELAQAIASWDVAASGDALFEPNGALSRLIGRPTTSLSVAMANVLQGRH